MTLCAWIFRFQILVVALWVVWVSTDSQAQTGRLDPKVPEVVIVGGDVPIIREKRSVRIVPERLPAVQWVVFRGSEGGRPSEAQCAEEGAIKNVVGIQVVRAGRSTCVGVGDRARSKK